MHNTVQRECVLKSNDKFDSTVKNLQDKDKKKLEDHEQDWQGNLYNIVLLNSSQ